MSFGEDLDRQREHVMRLVQHASESWAEAMRAHILAPPDAGFAARLRGLAEAAATEQLAWEQAQANGLMWRPVPGAEKAEPPYELRPGTGRRGPGDLWEQFDLAVARLNRAIAGSSSGKVAEAFGEMAEIAAALAAAVEREDELTRGAQQRALAAQARARELGRRSHDGEPRAGGPESGGQLRRGVDPDAGTPESGGQVRRAADRG